MGSGTIHKLIALFNEAFEQLGACPAPKKVEDLSVMVHKAMTLHARNYHTLEHVFSFIQPNDPINTIAAMYHDLVYYQVDRSFLPEIRRIIAPYIIEKDGHIHLRETLPRHDRVFDIILSIFGLTSRTNISEFDGLNEFLSAVVMSNQLQDVIEEKDLLNISICIEASIPFRDKDYFEKLETKVRAACSQFQCPLDEAEIASSIKRAVRFANKDVESFAETNASKFLIATWKLLPETNEALRARDVYTIIEFRRALEKTEKFLSTLDPESVFHSYQGAPVEETFHRMAMRVKTNLAIAREYFQVKLLTLAILEALAEVTGGDAPLALFMGELPNENGNTRRLEDYLPEIEEITSKQSVTAVDKILQAGRIGEASFDLHTSPLSLFIYRQLPPEDLDEFFDLAQKMFAGDIQTDNFLDELPPPIVHPIAKASAAMVSTRRKTLLKYAQN
jgi:hypothetical protein